MSEKEDLELTLLREQQAKNTQDNFDNRYSLKWVEKLLIRMGKLLLWLLALIASTTIIYYLNLYFNAKK